jgi:hypothetical protein
MPSRTTWCCSRQYVVETMCCACLVWFGFGHAGPIYRPEGHHERQLRKLHDLLPVVCAIVPRPFRKESWNQQLAAERMRKTHIYNTRLCHLANAMENGCDRLSLHSGDQSSRCFSLAEPAQPPQKRCSAVHISFAFPTACVLRSKMSVALSFEGSSGTSRRGDETAIVGCIRCILGFHDVFVHGLWTWVCRVTGDRWGGSWQLIYKLPDGLCDGNEYEIWAMALRMRSARYVYFVHTVHDRQ